IWIENDHAWRPQRVESMEIRGVLFDVCFEWHEVVVNKCGSLGIVVCLGFQPSTCASCRSGAKVDEHRLLLRLGFRERRVSVCSQMYFHHVSYSVVLPSKCSSCSSASLLVL